MIRPQFILDLNRELIVDNFAGGGGASSGIELALGRHVDLAINHDPMAVALHTANHPQTQHFCEDVFKVDPRKATNGRPVGLAWFSPDCKHFSKAKGGKPRSKKIRGLAWVVVKWAATVKPRVIVLENVEEFQDWGPLLANGQPCPKRKGRTFRNFISRLQNLGYAVEWRELRACDYGAPTIRKRLFLIARCDGQPIVWPNATHGDPNAEGFNRRKIKPWRTAAECIDWSLPCPSIFLTADEAKELRKQCGIKVNRPLAERTMRRIARGVVKFVLNSKEPFIVPLTHQGGDSRVESITEPFRTVTGAHRGEKALVVPFVSGVGGRMGQTPERSAAKPFQTITAKADAAVVLPFLTEHANASTQRTFNPDEPLRTQCAEVRGGHFALVQAFLAKHYGGVVGSKLQAPIGTITSRDHHSLVASHITKLYGTNTGQRMDEPTHTITSGGQHLGVIAAHLEAHYGQKGNESRGASLGEPLNTVTASPRHSLISAFLQKYYGTGGQDQTCKDPLHTIPTVDRFGLVTVEIDGEPRCIVDIGMLMLVARELYRAQGFPDTYVISIMVWKKRGKKMVYVPLPSEDQVRMCGNSVCPPLAKAIVAANVPELAVWRNGERKAFEKTVAQYRAVA